jgi:hypothetical protein
MGHRSHPFSRKLGFRDNGVFTAQGSWSRADPLSSVSQRCGIDHRRVPLTLRASFPSRSPRPAGTASSNA